MSNAISLAKELQSMKAIDVIRNERVRNQFISVYNSIWKEGGEQVYEREAIYFNQQLRDKQNLRECSGTSIFYAFIDLAVKGLTLATGAQALCYLIPRSVKIGIDQSGKDIWEKVCNLTISGYGELVLRKNAGQIRHADNPVIVYEGDTFQYGEQNGQKIVNYMSAFPRRSNKIIACFLKITRADGTIDYSVMTEQDWMRLKGYSDKQNTYYDSKTRQYVTKSNELYGKDGQIDTGFLMAKCVKHAFKTYPKLNIGRGTALETEIIEQHQPADFDPYGGVDDGQSEHQEQSFAPAPDMSAGVTIDPTQQSDNNGDDTF
jgi:recombinational DNA repair protein RecT|nr:MAG: RecT family protein [Bacteriophage sp.]UWH98691.1 MAG: RecT family protein [Bacteriophage sp.]UWI27374.1 MAG: RecT family protein [Bacteriophage sp.]UWI29226.1 MAG: RecT family protein [Bacteriophage sp.]